MYESTKCQYSKEWYLVLAGAAVGGVLSWFILYIYGVFQEEQASKIAEQREIIEKQAKLHVLLEDQEN